MDLELHQLNLNIY